MPGKIIGRGRTAEIYEYDKGRVVKLFHKGCESWANMEASRSLIACQNNVPTPFMHGTLEHEGRAGIIYDRLNGIDLGRVLGKAPWQARFLGRDTARIHLRINAAPGEGLDDQKTMFLHRIKDAPGIPGWVREGVIPYLDALPAGDRLCHGDLHAENYIRQGKELLAIDWLTAYSGHPAGDVARVLLLMESPSISESLPPPFRPLIKLVLRQYVSQFKKVYYGNAPFDASLTDRFLLPCAAVRLTEEIPHEREWLLEIIRKELE